ncbi:cyclic pyranopterin monophosphate synthase accessory protein [Chloropicon primus]|uniref:cyclic pyranopterin monophosphate synthase n=2 Tax=Chloropicon primus TaxID=1764295 RepID=A0A5B8MRV6_9CHLO|nr:cyclic pyranopterin monophosphate synthase accessory protein [Chloropicon primus]UPR01602.1 cyclic pyranopterin monophosphate synthase accessory protein [Chloropicon primus]|eukprot:QDZ22385.1 cyclic pyranopterin monophosphate synthase accessory protein [Chloropicon primus]
MAASSLRALVARVCATGVREARGEASATFGKDLLVAIPSDFWKATRWTRGISQEGGGGGGGGSEVSEINDEFEEVFGQKLGERGGGAMGEVQKDPRVGAVIETRVVEETSMASRQGLTHVDEGGECNMVDVGGKEDTTRVAEASARVVLEPHVYEMVASDKMKKGNVLSVAQIAGIQAAKKTSDLIPLCHNLVLNQVRVDCALEQSTSCVEITSSARTTGKTGVEMEALTACTVAALTVYDMCKAASKKTRITDVRLVSKSGGKSGDFRCMDEQQRQER